MKNKIKNDKNELSISVPICTKEGTTNQVSEWVIKVFLSFFLFFFMQPQFQYYFQRLDNTLC